MPAREHARPATDLIPEEVARPISVSAYGGFLVAQQAARLTAARGSGAILLIGALTRETSD